MSCFIRQFLDPKLAAIHDENYKKYLDFKQDLASSIWVGGTEKKK